MSKVKHLLIKGKPVAEYQIEIDVLYLGMLEDFPEEEAIRLISEIEKVKFLYIVPGVH